MKLTILTTTLLLCSASYAMAGPGAGEPKEPADPASGRPSAVLDDAKCTSVWSMTERDGDTLSEGKAAPFIVNFKMVDADNDGKITEAEFKEGCKKGLVQEASATGSQQPAGIPSSGEAMQPAEKTTPTTPQP
jgi:EF hand